MRVHALRREVLKQYGRLKAQIVNETMANALRHDEIVKLIDILVEDKRY